MSNVAPDVVTRAIVGPCARLHISVIAAGVDTIEEASALRALGVRLFQGYLFARPAIEQLPQVPAAIIDAVLTAGEARLLEQPAIAMARRAP